MFVLAGATPGTAGETAGFFALLTAYWLKQSQEQPRVAPQNSERSDWFYFRHSVPFVPTVQNARGRLNPAPHQVVFTVPTVSINFHGGRNSKKTIKYGKPLTHETVK